MCQQRKEWKRWSSAASERPRTPLALQPTSLQATRTGSLPLLLCPRGQLWRVYPGEEGDSSGKAGGKGACEDGKPLFQGMHQAQPLKEAVEQTRCAGCQSRGGHFVRWTGWFHSSPHCRYHVMVPLVMNSIQDWFSRLVPVPGRQSPLPSFHLPASTSHSSSGDKNPSPSSRFACIREESTLD